MNKVVIIDDEPIILEGLLKVVPWEEHNCEVVGTAEDGYTGAKLIRDMCPDILMTDISMPGIDGLSMVAGLKSEFPHMQISILTGYRDFDYAQKAIRLGVTRFLLKPSNMTEIEEALDVMGEKLAAYRRMKKQMEQSEEAEALSAEDTETESAGKAADSVDKAEDETAAACENSEHPDGVGAAGSFIVKNALRYIQENYKEKLTLNEVAEKTYVSQWHLSKLLNKQLGQNFSEILNHVRLEEAKKLLCDPALRIGDIAEAVGFLDLAHFSRVFKKTFGVSANEYRNGLAMEDIQAENHQ